MTEPTPSPADLLETIADLVEQFAYQVQWQGRAALSTGGLSALEDAFRVLGWPDPKPMYEHECQAEGCHAWVTCGTPTPDGYKRLCGAHYRELRNKTKEVPECADPA